MHDRLNAARILDRSYFLYKKSFTKQAAPLAALNAIMALLLALILGVGVGVILPALANNSNNSIASGLYSLAVIVPLVLLAIYLMQKLLEAAAIIVAASYKQQGAGVNLKTIFKLLPRVFGSAVSELLLSLVFIVIVALILVKSIGLGNIMTYFGSGTEKTSFIAHIITNSNTFSLALAAVLSLMIYNLAASLFCCSTAIAVLEGKSFSAPIASARYCAKKERFFHIFFVNLVTSVSSVGFFYLIYMFVDVIPVAAWFYKIPYGSYLTDLYYFALTYILTILTSPITRITHFAIYTAERASYKSSKAFFGSRLAATMIDIAIVGLVAALAVYIAPLIAFSGDFTSIISGLSPGSMLLLCFCLLCCLMIYTIFFELAFNGQTIGKMVLGIRAVSNNDTPRHPLQAVLRGIVKYCADIFAIGSILILINGTRLGDILASTSVVYKEHNDANA